MTPFEEAVLNLVDLIPRGKVATYGQIARKLNSKAYQAVGQALNKNPNLFVRPCHRVVNSKGQLGGYALGPAKKRELLLKEGVEVHNDQIDLRKFIFEF